MWRRPVILRYRKISHHVHLSSYIDLNGAEGAYENQNIKNCDGRLLV